MKKEDLNDDIKLCDEEKTATTEKEFDVADENKENVEEKENKEQEDLKDSKDLKIEELNDRLIRNMAEFDNFRKRSEREKESMFDMGASHIINKILPTIDNFERALKTPVTDESKAFLEGMDMIYKQLLKSLKEAGVEPIECLDKKFDPNFHNAVMHIEDENLGENIIVEELQKGYIYKDTVIRYSMVKVAN